MPKINKIIVFSFVFSLFIFIPILTGAQIIKTVISGTTEGEGKHFEITNSTYLNITLDSSESIKLRIESIPEMITMMFEKSVLTLATQTQITIQGLAPSTTHYLYEDDYHNLNEITADENGGYIYTQDLSKPHFVFIQPRKSTKFIQDNSTGGDCVSIGIWNTNTKTCTLTTDITESIQIDNDGITLYGNNHAVTGTNTGFGVYLYQKSGVIIKNIRISAFVAGIRLYGSFVNTLTANTVLNNGNGIFLFYSADNTLSGNRVESSTGANIYLQSSNGNTIVDNAVSLNIGGGIVLVDSDNNNLADNNLSLHNSCGICVINSEDNEITKNTSNSNGYGIYLGNSSNSSVYQNNFINNTYDNAYVDGGFANFFDNGYPSGGNYWSDFDTSAEGCSDTNSDNICDYPYVFSGGQDNLPWVKQDGWVSIRGQAANLAKLVINGPYLGDGDTYGGKGWDPVQSEYVTANQIFNGYNFWNNKLRLIDFDAGVDCSGLVQWAFNRSFDPQKSLLNNVIRYDGADGQYKNNSETIAEANLQPGDLLFLDKNGNGIKDHVAMYVGDNGTFDIIEAFSPRRGIISSSKVEFETRPGFVANQDFRRVVLSPSIGGQVKASSPIDLIVTNPDGFTITPITAIQTDEEYLREIPGELYYAENVLGADGHPEDIIYWPKRKTGDYIIKVLPESGAFPTETYSVKFTVGEQTTMLADNIPLNQIPSGGYGVRVNEDNTISLIQTLVPSADTYVKLETPNKNQGTEQKLNLQYLDAHRILIQFNQEEIKSVIPTDKIVVSVKLQFTITKNGNMWGKNGNTIGAYRMTKPWIEYGATWLCADDTNTFNTRPDCPGTLWGMAGFTKLRPYTTSPTDTKIITNNQSGIVSFDVTNDVKKFLSGEIQNYGWLVKKTNLLSTGWIEFGSRESTKTPKLIIEIK